MTDLDRHREATLGLTRALLVRVSPAEVPLLDVMGSQLIDARPRRSDGALGFGAEEVAWIAAAVPIATAVSDILLDVVKGAASDLVKDWATRTLGRFHNPPADATVSTPSDAAVVIERAERAAHEHALALGLDEARARLLSDAVRGSLSAAPDRPRSTSP